jgi:hypothetical protein
LGRRRRMRRRKKEKDRNNKAAQPHTHTAGGGKWRSSWQILLLVRGLRFRNATDGLISMKAGYPTVMLGSITEFKALLADQVRVLGPDHPHTLTTRTDLASWRGQAGDVAGAVKQNVLVRLDHDEAVVTEVLGEPVGRDEALGMGVVLQGWIGIRG